MSKKNREQQVPKESADVPKAAKPRKATPPTQEGMAKSPQKPRAKKAEAPKPKKSMSLTALAIGMPGLTPASGKMLAEAAAVCLEDRQHQPGVKFPQAGLVAEDFHVEWPAVDDQCRRCYADMQEATERGACGVAILVVKEATGLVVIDRSKKGTGFDYWLGEEDSDGLPFANGVSRLEVSGILAGTKSQIDSRVKEKKGQMKRSDHVAPGFVAVVEFGTPVACVESK
jgi:hypothetical protein